MEQVHGIIVFGLNGCGKTTLARELGRLLGYQHIDAEDYCFEPAEIPYAHPIPRQTYVPRMLNDIRQQGSFVLSSVPGSYSEELSDLIHCGIFLSVPTELRLQRIEQRERMRWGSRLCEGGDMYQQHKAFINFAATRPSLPVEQYAQSLCCPLLRVDGSRDWRKIAATLAGEVKDLL